MGSQKGRGKEREVPTHMLHALLKIGITALYQTYQVSLITSETPAF